MTLSHKSDVRPLPSFGFLRRNRARTRCFGGWVERSLASCVIARILASSSPSVSFGSFQIIGPSVPILTFPRFRSEQILARDAGQFRLLSLHLCRDAGWRRPGAEFLSRISSRDGG